VSLWVCLWVYYKRGSNIRDLAGLFVSLFYVFIGGYDTVLGFDWDCLLKEGWEEGSHRS
jgi:hypothetical protein